MFRENEYNSRIILSLIMIKHIIKIIIILKSNDSFEMVGLAKKGGGVELAF